ncbi:pullulanase type I [Striga asiatica]|uniref:Pullulanase type I n=1 Tax=Striga asiatica TaxID=4170 RepID=A0A5A7PXI6_STRAF|nr:pullulanase type I [Striga asiatica]
MVLTVGDSTGIVTVLCWDRVAKDMIGKSCKELRMEMIEIGDGSTLPTDLEDLESSSEGEVSTPIKKIKDGHEDITSEKLKRKLFDSDSSTSKKIKEEDEKVKGSGQMVPLNN